MQVTITLPDELADEVQARGFDLSTYVRALVEEKLFQETADQNQRRSAVEAMIRFAANHGFKSGGQGLKSMVHEGHKY